MINVYFLGERNFGVKITSGVVRDAKTDEVLLVLDGCEWLVLYSLQSRRVGNLVGIGCLADSEYCCQICSDVYCLAGL